MDQAACAGSAPSRSRDSEYRDIFFPERGQGYRSAMETCFWCPVRLKCKDLRGQVMPEYGVWAGSIVRRGKKNSKNDGAQKAG